MKLGNKKIVAREFIFFMLSVFIAIIAFICIYPYNYILETQNENLKNEIIVRNKVIDSLNNVNVLKTKNQIEFTKESNFNTNSNDDNIVVWEALSDLINDDKLSFQLEKDWKNKKVIRFLLKQFKDYKDFYNFISSNIVKPEDLKLIKKLNSEIKTLNFKIDNRIKAKFNFNEQLNFMKYIFLIMVFACFILRYTFYGIIWSINELKQN